MPQASKAVGKRKNKAESMIRKKEKDTVIASLKEEFEKRMEILLKHKTELLDKLHADIEMIAMTIPPEQRDKTFEQLAQEAEIEKQKMAATEPVLERSRKRSMSCIIEDEGYLTEDSRGRPLYMRRLSRSLSRSHVKASTSNTSSRMGPPSCSSTHLSRSHHKTPLFNRTRTVAKYGVITPKVAPNNPLTLLRRPKQGEVAVSLSGSPLMVSSMADDNTANVNIPFNNGTVMSLLPTRMGHLDSKRCPPLDSEMRNQIKGLMENLDKLMRFNPKTNSS